MVGRCRTGKCAVNPLMLGQQRRRLRSSDTIPAVLGPHLNLKAVGKAGVSEESQLAENFVGHMLKYHAVFDKTNM